MSSTAPARFEDTATDMALLLFALDNTQYALHLSIVERVLPLVEIVPLPGAPPIIVGVVNFQGNIVPVADLRRRFGLATRQRKLNDQLIVARIAQRTIALLVDSTINVIKVDPDVVVNATRILNGIGQVEGVVKLESGLVLIHDLTTLLSLEEERTLDAAMQEV